MTFLAGYSASEIEFHVAAMVGPDEALFFQFVVYVIGFSFLADVYTRSLALILLKIALIGAAMWFDDGEMPRDLAGWRVGVLSCISVLALSVISYKRAVQRWRELPKGSGK